MFKKQNWSRVKATQTSALTFRLSLILLSESICLQNYGLRRKMEIDLLLLQSGATKSGFKTRPFLSFCFLENIMHLELNNCLFVSWIINLILFICVKYSKRTKLILGKQLEHGFELIYANRQLLIIYIYIYIYTEREREGRGRERETRQEFISGRWGIKFSATDENFEG